MKEILALTLPGQTQSTQGFPYLKPEVGDATIGGLLSQFLVIAFYIAGFLMFFWFAWGVFQYIFAGGNKDALAKARSRLIWAVVGFIIVILSFAISQYVEQVLPPLDLPKGVTEVKP